MTQETTDQINKVNRVRWLAGALISIGVLSGVIAIVLTLQHPEPAGAPSTTASESAPAPVANKPTPKEVAAYTVAPDLPKYLSIPAIKADKIRVTQLGLTKDRSIASPANIFDAGWYKESAKPGQDGAMFVYGHVSNWEANGAFHDLKKLKPGDTVTITRGDDHDFTYKVIRSETYPASTVPMDKVLTPAIAGQQGLNVMTCAGQVIKGTNDFSERLVVYTTLIKS
jgi:sortase (surface protein transpeptidase)